MIYICLYYRDYTPKVKQVFQKKKCRYLICKQGNQFYVTGTPRPTPARSFFTLGDVVEPPAKLLGKRGVTFFEGRWEGEGCSVAVFT